MSPKVPEPCLKVSGRYRSHAVEHEPGFSTQSKISVKTRYPLDGLTPVLASYPNPQATWTLRGRPSGVAKAPCSLERSWRMAWTLMTLPLAEIWTEPATMATSTS